MTRRNYKPHEEFEDDQNKKYSSNTDRSSPLVDHEKKGEISKFIKDDSMKKALDKKGIKHLFPIQYETFDQIY